VDIDAIAEMYPDSNVFSLLAELDGAGLFGEDTGFPTSAEPLPEAPKKLARQSVYVMESAGRIKIGIAANVKSRLSAVQTGNPNPVTLVWSVAVPDAVLIEMQAHAILSAHRMIGEWFNCTRDQAVEAVRSAIERSSA
jgi:hypothetical protein